MMASGQLVVPKGSPVETRFLSYVDIAAGGCWMWIGSSQQDGYATFTVRRGVSGPAHRYAFERWVGPIPAGLELDHLCRVRLCVNPDHLEAVTHEENVHRGMRARFGPGWTPPAKRAGPRWDVANVCKHGHPWVEHGHVQPSGRKVCRLCERVRDARKRARRAKVDR